MEQKEVEELVKKEILKAKLEVAEKRLNYLLIIAGCFLTVFGLLLPLLFTNTSSNKVDAAIEKLDAKTETMQTEFYNRNIESEKIFRESVKEIASQQNSVLLTISNNADKTLKETKEKVEQALGQQLTRPILTCLFNGQEINGKTISIKRNENPVFEIFNKGDAPAKNVKVIIYLKENSKINWFSGGYWFERTISEEQEFKKSYIYGNNIDIIDAAYSAPVEIQTEESIKPAKEVAMLKIFYGQPEPIKIKFFMEQK